MRMGAGRGAAHMIPFLIRRLIGGVIVVWVVSVVTFGIFQIGPIVTGADAAYLYTGKNTTPAAVAAVREKLGLNRPIPVQYGLFVKGIVAGREYTDGVTTVKCKAPCLGYSFSYEQPVVSLIEDRLPITVSIAIGAFVLWLVGGVLIGIVSALNRGRFVDRAGMVFALLGVSLPVFFTGLLLLFTFSYGPTWLRLFPNIGYVGFTTNPIRWASNLMLLWITLALSYAALYARLTRANVMETMSEDYIRTATAKGLPRRTVIIKHGLRAALTPIVTIAGLDLGGLLGGAILVETVFSFPGLGLMSYQAINNSDLPIIMGVTIVGALFIVVANIFVDIVYVYVDPRVRLN
jgi:peptide/nickel transport system permease protein